MCYGCPKAGIRPHTEMGGRKLQRTNKASHGVYHIISYHIILYLHGMGCSGTALGPDRMRHHEERLQIGNPTPFRGVEDVSAFPSP